MSGAEIFRRVVEGWENNGTLRLRLCGILPDEEQSALLAGLIELLGKGTIVTFLQPVDGATPVRVIPPSAMTLRQAVEDIGAQVELSHEPVD